MKTFILAALLATSAVADDMIIYEMPYGNIDLTSINIRNNEFSFRIKELHMMPAVCLQDSRFYFSGDLALSDRAEWMIYRMALQKIPAAYIKFGVDSEDKCHLKEIVRRTVSNAPDYLLARVYLHPVIIHGSFQAEGCPDPYSPYPVFGFEYRITYPSGVESPIYGGHMQQYTGNTCTSNNLIDYDILKGEKWKWRITHDGYRTDWVTINGQVD